MLPEHKNLPTTFRILENEIFQRFPVDSMMEVHHKNFRLFVNLRFTIPITVYFIYVLRYLGKFVESF